MKILAFDQSTTITGWAVFEDNVLERCGAINLSKVRKSNIKAQQMYREIDAMVLRVNPDIVVFEDVNLQVNIKTLVLLARVQGVIQQAAWTRRIPIKIYPPSSWRRYVGLHQGEHTKRDALKQEAVRMVHEKYPDIVLESDDVAEAVCIGMAYWIDRSGTVPDVPAQVKHRRAKRAREKQEELLHGKSKKSSGERSRRGKRSDQCCEADGCRAEKDQPV